jgi:DNA-binding CsgD family transcriptional regulator
MAHEMLGRTDELAVGRRFLEATGNGPACLVIEGQPGIGKTMLWQLIGEEAAASGMRLLMSRPSELETDLPHVSLADLFEPVAAEMRPELPAPQRRALDLALLSGEEDDDDADLRALGTAILASLRHLASRAPVVVAIDDLQWADRATVGALGFAARRLKSDRVGLLLARRPAALTPEAEALETAFANSWREACALEPMSLGGLHRLIDERFGINLPRPSLVHLERATLGVPLFAIDLVDALRRDGRAMTPDAIVRAPVEIERMVALRLEPLAHDARRVVDAVAAVGRPDLELLDGLEGHGVETALESAIEHGLLEREADRVRFAHPLYRSVVYRAMQGEYRRQLHLRIAQLVGDRGTSSLHLAMGTDAPNADVAKVIADEAAAAEQRGTAASAAVLYEHASRITPSDAVGPRADRMLSLARLLWELGEVDRSRVITHEVVRIAPPGSTRVLARLLEGTHALWTTGAAAAIDAYGAALGDAAGEPELEAAVHLRIAYVTDHDVALAIEHAGKAALLAEGRPGAVDLAACALLMLADFELSLGRPYDADRAERGRAMLLGAASPRRPRSSIDAHRIARERSWLLHAATDDLATARAELAAIRRADEDGGIDRPAPIAYLDLAELSCQLGDAMAARSYAELAEQFAAQTGNLPYAAAGAALAGALVAEHVGDLERAEALARRAGEAAAELGDGPMLDRVAVVEARLGLARQRARHAAEVLLEVEANVEASGIRHPGFHRFRGELVEALVLAGRLEEGRAQAAIFSAAVQASPTPWGLAVAARSRGLVAAASGDLESALVELAEAHAQQVALPMPVERGRTLVHLGRVHRRRRKKRVALDAFDAAVRAFDSAGAAGWARLARAEGERVSSRTAGVSQLTTTEREVARLAAGGMTNRQVADAMVISPKTVDGALTRVYAKLDIHSRAELGAWLMRENARTQG